MFIVITDFQSESDWKSQCLNSAIFPRILSKLPRPCQELSVLYSNDRSAWHDDLVFPRFLGSHVVWPTFCSFLAERIFLFFPSVSSPLLYISQRFWYRWNSILICHEILGNLCKQQVAAARGVIPGPSVGHVCLLGSSMC